MYNGFQFSGLTEAVGIQGKEGISKRYYKKRCVCVCVCVCIYIYN